MRNQSYLQESAAKSVHVALIGAVGVYKRLRRAPMGRAFARSRRHLAFGKDGGQSKVCELSNLFSANENVTLDADRLSCAVSTGY
jgi:hypothetical protein